ncbi:unnamed protein product, partial [Mycena citricolor]
GCRHFTALATRVLQNYQWPFPAMCNAPPDHHSHRRLFECWQKTFIKEWDLLSDTSMHPITIQHLRN